MSRICYLYLCISDCSLYKPLTHPQVKQTQCMIIPHFRKTYGCTLLLHTLAECIPYVLE